MQQQLGYEQILFTGWQASPSHFDPKQDARATCINNVVLDPSWCKEAWRTTIRSDEYRASVCGDRTAAYLVHEIVVQNILRGQETYTRPTPRV